MAEGAAAAPTAPPWGPRGFGRGLRARILLSILGPIAWLVFTLLYVGFWASGFSLFQDIIVVLVSILVLIAVVAAAWITWAGGRRWHWD